MDHFYGLYGIGAVIITIFSKYFSKNKVTLFIGGFLIGALTEYLASFLLETVMNIRWWDYSGYILNINGRICLLYSAFWGILTPFLMKSNKVLDRLINKIAKKVPMKLLKTIIIVLVLFMFIDCVLTGYAQKQFLNRMIVENNIDVENKEEIEKEYNKTYENEFLSRIILKFWNNEKMIKTFPNMKIEDKDHNNIYLDSLLPEIQPYYKKIFNK